MATHTNRRMDQAHTIEREDPGRRADETAELHSEALIMLDAAHRRARALKDQVAASRALFLESQQQLYDRDKEYSQTTRELLQARDEAEAKLRRGETHFAKLQEALEAWHTRSEEEFEQSKQILVDERDAACRHALAAETRCRILELRFEHILMEFPRRILRKLKQKLRRKP